VYGYAAPATRRTRQKPRCLYHFRLS